MNAIIWILQILLALAFLAAGLTKISQPRQKLASTMGWVEDFSDPAVRTIGALEVLGALGLLLPALTGMATVLVPIAAVGLAVLMIGAAGTHRRRGELPMIGINAVLLLLAVVVAWARFGPYSL
jgi:uncharacterized membrane protein YphA (DoxX/SURF4 family)